jgi:cysteinyl-tRNA synthetase
MNIRVYNTLTRDKEPFQTVTPGKVGMYLCGPTVYREAHIGHMVGPVIFDCIKRYLEYCGFDVTWVVNITDVDDKLINEATKRGIPMSQVAEEMTKDYIDNLAAFGVDQIDEMPRATEHIPDIIKFIARLIERDYAYESHGDVFFEVSKDQDYGKLTNRSSDSQQGEGGEAATRKRSPSDFALWKKAKRGEPSWKSPWGAGRPGWHIECSAMSHALLGETFDIHGGGLDLVFPHHENEIAQSESCHGKPMARYWMHNGLMRASTAAGKVGGRGEREQQPAAADVSTKISRSKGAGGLAELIQQQGGERLRFFLLRTHYRSTIVFGAEGLAEAGTALETFYRFMERYERVTGEGFYTLPAASTRLAGDFDPGNDALLVQVAQRRNGFLDKMDDDFNSGGAISELFDLVRLLNRFADKQSLEEVDTRTAADLDSFRRGAATMKELTNVLGLFRQPPAKTAGAGGDVLEKLMPLMVAIRSQARAAKDFATADRVRDELAQLGITLEDRKEGTGWRMASDDTETLLAGVMELLIELRSQARKNKDFAMADQIRDQLTAAGITLEDRKGETVWRVDT